MGAHIEIIPDKQPLDEHAKDAANTIYDAANLGRVYVFQFADRRFTWCYAGRKNDENITASNWLKMPDRKFVGCYDGAATYSEILEDLTALIRVEK